MITNHVWQSHRSKRRQARRMSLLKTPQKPLLTRSRSTRRPQRATFRPPLSPPPQPLTGRRAQMIRQSRRRSLWRSWGRTLEEAVWLALIRSRVCWASRRPRVCLGVWEVMPVGKGVCLAYQMCSLSTMCSQDQGSRCYHLIRSRCMQCRPIPQRST